MPTDTSGFIEHDLRDRLNRALCKDSIWGEPYGAFFASLRMHSLNGFLFGGTIRDVLLKGKPRDLDIVFDSDTFQRFSTSFASHIKRKNRFGGLKCSYLGIEIDAWPLLSTWAISRGLTSGNDFDVLPETAFFNLDAIVAEIAPNHQRRIFQRKFFEGIAQKEIECNFDKTDFPILNIVRGFVLAQRTGFHFSNSFSRFIAEHQDSPAAYEKCQWEHYKQVRLSGEVIASLALKIAGLLESNAKATFQPVFPNPPTTAQLHLEMDPDPGWWSSTTEYQQTEVIEKQDHLFISYASEDQYLASWLARKLSSRGHQVWFDKMKLLGGESWPQSIDEAIKKRTFRMLAILSRHSIDKSKPRSERTLAQNIAENTGVPDFLIPLKVDDCDLDWMSTCMSYISFRKSWADGWRALVEKLDSISAPRNLPAGGVLAATTFPNGDEYLNTNGETLFTNLLPVKHISPVLKVFRVTETFSAQDWQVLRKAWSFYRLADDAFVAFKPPPHAFGNRIRPTPEQCLWAECPLMRNRASGDVAAHLVMRTLGKKLQDAGCVSHPNHLFRNTYFLPETFSPEGKLFFIGFTGRKTWLLIKRKVTFRRGLNRELNYYHFAFRLKLARMFPDSFYLQITPSLIFFDSLNRPILDRTVGTRRRKITKMWWNDKWLNRLLATKTLLTALPSAGEEDVVLDTQLATLSSSLGIREEAFALADERDASDEDPSDNEFVLEDGEGDAPDE